MFKYEGKYGNIHIDGTSMDIDKIKKESKDESKKTNQGNC